MSKDVITFEHKGYVGRAKWDEELGMYSGAVISYIQGDVITFRGKSKKKAKKKFCNSVDEYLKFYKELGRKRPPPLPPPPRLEKL